MTNNFFALLGVSLSFIAASSALANPLFDGADPDIWVENQTYWIYPTTEGIEKKDFFTHSSKDLKHWKRLGPILEAKDVSWIKDDGAPLHELWAPGIFKNGNRYYLFFAVGPQNPTPSRIGVAVADAPDGKFIDSGKPLITGDNKFEAIDPMVFKDSRSGKIFLYCGGSAGAKLRMYELNDDCISIKKEIEVETPKNFTEGPFMHLRGNTYYLSYSHGRWNDSSYGVCYSTSDAPTGPWTYRGEILKSNKSHAGPGHHAFVQDPASGNWYIIYHRWNNAIASGKMPSMRSVSIDSVAYDDKGLILPIEMTDTDPSKLLLERPLPK